MLDIDLVLVNALFITITTPDPTRKEALDAESRSPDARRGRGHRRGDGRGSGEGDASTGGLEMCPRQVLKKISINEMYTIIHKMFMVGCELRFRKNQLFDLPM